MKSYYNRGIELLERGRLDAAIATFRKGLQEKPNSPKMLGNLGTALLRKKEWDAAIEAFQQSLQIPQIHRDYSLTHTNLGTAYQQKGEIKAAIAEYQLAIKLDPPNVNAYYMLGTAYQATGYHREAIEQFKKLLSIDPDHGIAHYELGRSLTLMTQWDAALNELQQARKLLPNSSPVLEMLAQILLIKGLPRQAFAEYRRTISRNPFHLGHYLCLCRFLILRSRFMRAPNYQGRQ